MGTTTDKLQKILDSKNAIKTAIEEKGVTNIGDVLSEYANKIASIQTGGSGWTGHADVEGLKAIGWDDEDIAYYQEHGVNWNEEDDEYHKVPQDNIDLYGIVNIDNIGDYKDIIVYLPKIDLNGKTDLSNKFENFYSLIAVPNLNILNDTIMTATFKHCESLVSFNIDLSKAKSLQDTFGYAYSIKRFKFDLLSTTTLYGFMYGCRAIEYIESDIRSVISAEEAFANCSSLRFCNLKNLKTSIKITDTSLLEKSSLLYMIENATPTETIIITLSAYCYNKYSVDPDVIAALEKQPLVTLASA